MIGVGTAKRLRFRFGGLASPFWLVRVFGITRRAATEFLMWSLIAQPLACITACGGNFLAMANPPPARIAVKLREPRSNAAVFPRHSGYMGMDLGPRL